MTAGELPIKGSHTYVLLLVVFFNVFPDSIIWTIHVKANCISIKEFCSHHQLGQFLDIRITVNSDSYSPVKQRKFLNRATQMNSKRNQFLLADSIYEMYFSSNQLTVWTEFPYICTFVCTANILAFLAQTLIQYLNKRCIIIINLHPQSTIKYHLHTTSCLLLIYYLLQFSKCVLYAYI